MILETGTHGLSFPWDGPFRCGGSVVIGVREQTKSRKPGPGFEAAVAHQMGLEGGQGRGHLLQGAGGGARAVPGGAESAPAGPRLRQQEPRVLAVNVFFNRHPTV